MMPVLDNHVAAMVVVVVVDNRDVVSRVTLPGNHRGGIVIVVSTSIIAVVDHNGVRVVSMSATINDNGRTRPMPAV